MARSFWRNKALRCIESGLPDDVLIAVVERLKGSPEAFTSVYPQTLVLSCYHSNCKCRTDRERPE
jgi:transposase-like protein